MSIFVLVLNGLLRLNLEVWFKLKVLVFLNGGGLVLNFFVLVFVIKYWIYVILIICVYYIIIGI